MSLIIIGYWIFFSSFFLWGKLKNDFSVADVAWAFSFVLLFFLSAYSVDQDLSIRQKFIGACLIIWALRLSAYIFFRNLKIGKEDERYTKMREGWGEKFLIKAYLRVFILQGCLSLIIGSSLILFVFSTSALKFPNHLDMVGIALWGIGLSWESIADYQKSKFKQNPENKGKLCRVGLWKLSRYPNYFGEMLLWFGFGSIFLNQIPIWQAYLGPTILALLMINVSGIAILEKKYRAHPEYEDYAKSTNLLIPGFPRNTSVN